MNNQFKSTLLISVFAICSLALTNCKKKYYGCTDDMAENFSTVATEDDGSCFYKEIVEPIEAKTYIEEFELTFSSTVSFGSFSPSFSSIMDNTNDIIILETMVPSSGSTWTALPFISNNTNISGEYDSSTGTITVNTNRVDSGSPYIWSLPITKRFRATLLRK